MKSIFGFWQEVLIASVRAGNTVEYSKMAADKAVAFFSERLLQHNNKETNNE